MHKTPQNNLLHIDNGVTVSCDTTSGNHLQFKTFLQINLIMTVQAWRESQLNLFTAFKLVVKTDFYRFFLIIFQLLFKHGKVTALKFIYFSIYKIHCVKLPMLPSLISVCQH